MTFCFCFSFSIQFLITVYVTHPGASVWHFQQQKKTIFVHSYSLICTNFKKEGAITLAKKSYSVVLLFFDVSSLCNYLLYMLLNIHDCSSWIVFFVTVSSWVFLFFWIWYSYFQWIEKWVRLLWLFWNLLLVFFQHSMINNDIDKTNKNQVTVVFYFIIQHHRQSTAANRDNIYQCSAIC